MAQRVPPFTISVKDGGRLISGGSADAVGVADYTEKVNFRRIDDAEAQREGTLLFKPLDGDQGYQAFLGSVSGSPDVVGLWEAVRPNGERAVIALTATDAYRFDAGVGTWSHIGGPFTSCLEWQVESNDGYLIFNNGQDLPFTYRVEDYAVEPIWEMRDIGIARVGCICVYNGFLMVADVTEISSDELAGWMNGEDPYGVVPDNICNRIRYKIAWSDYNAPREWAPLIEGVTIESGAKSTLIMPYPVPYSFPVGTKLAVIGAGPSGGTLGGQVGYDDGVAVTAVNGSEITIEVDADGALSYPLTVQVTRFADVSTFVGSSSIQDDSSAITLLKPLKRTLVVYRETGLWTGRYTAAVETPFVFTREWVGRLVPSHPRAVADVNGDYHVYPAKNRFYKFDGAGEPVLHRPTDDARSLFLTGLTADTAHRAWAVNNPITQEIWFFCPMGVLAYDYSQETCSWIDETYTAAAYVRKPGSDDFWFILSREGAVLQYGATEEGVITYARATGFGYSYESYYGYAVQVKPEARIKFGVTDLGDDLNEKDLISYTPLLATDSVDCDVGVVLRGGNSFATAFESVLSATLSTPATLPTIETYYRNIYFQDAIHATDSRDIGLSLVGRTFTVNRIRSKGVTRNAHGHS